MRPEARGLLYCTDYKFYPQSMLYVFYYEVSCYTNPWWCYTLEMFSASLAFSGRISDVEICFPCFQFLCPVISDTKLPLWFCCNEKLIKYFMELNYHQFSNIWNIKSQNLSISCSCLCAIYWSQLLSRDWRCTWSSTNRRCSNYIWVISNFIAYYGMTYIRSLMVLFEILQ